MDKQREFEILAKSLYLAHYQFSLNQIIHQEVNGALYTNYRIFWDTILLGLEQAYLLGLAMFFERPKDLDETISIYYFFDFGHNELINRLKKIRNKMIGHHDKKLAKPSYLEELKMNTNDVELLFKLATEAIEKLKADFGYIWQDHVITGVKVDREILKLQLKKLIEQIKK